MNGLLHSFESSSFEPLRYSMSCVVVGSVVWLAALCLVVGSWKLLSTAQYQPQRSALRQLLQQGVDIGGGDSSMRQVHASVCRQSDSARISAGSVALLISMQF